MQQGEHLPNPRQLLLPMVLLVVGWCLAVGAGPAFASHVSCGDTVTADTTLDADLVNCPNNGIVIGANDITLDLNGHTISGDDERFEPCPQGRPCDAGLLIEGHAGVTIKDGKITAFGTGLVVFRAKRNRFRELAAVENTFNGILLLLSSHNGIERSTASRNGTTTDSPGVAMVDSHDNRMTYNTLSHNGDLALILDGSNRNRIAHNKARGNPEDGMIIEGNRNEIVRNRLVRNGGGILITTVDRPGKVVGNVVSHNVVRHARGSGIAVDCCVPERGTIQRTLISRNLLIGNGHAGINISNPSTTITRNRAARNGGLGIRAVKGVIDGGGNRASGNGDPRQCLNVTCH